MSLAKLDVSNVRNIEAAHLEFSSRLNFIVGPNDGGKTSLLEAIYILGRARSFRSTQAGRVIRFDQQHLTVNGRVIDEAGVPPIRVGVRLGRRKREIVLAGSRLLTSAELIRAFPVCSSSLLTGRNSKRLLAPPSSPTRWWRNPSPLLSARS